MGFFEVNKIPLKVVMNDGFDVTSGSNISETTLLYDDQELNAPTFYFNKGFNGIDFEITIVMKEEYFYGGRAFMDYLNQWDKWNTVVTVVTDAMDVPNGKYVVRIKNKKQTLERTSIWKLRFKQYYENSLSFESMYTYKTSSLSAIDQTLLKYHEIDYYSPKEAILALQKKLQQKGCWDNMARVQDSRGVGKVIIVETDDGPDFKKREPNGIWDWQMKGDIFGFQTTYGLGESKQGKCDTETIQALVGDAYTGRDAYYKWTETM